MSVRETVMFKDPGMTIHTPEQPDDLERLFAAEEASIRDDGFSQRVTEQARGGNGWRRTAIYGAGMAGFGVAVASIIDMAPYVRKVSGWLDGLVVDADAVGASVPDTTLLAVAALVAGFSFLMIAVAAQDR